MPKEVLNIINFHGGISSDADPRDIKHIESTSLVDANVSSVGKVTTFGSVDTSSNGNTLTIIPNRGLFTYGSDRSIAGVLSDETFYAIADDGGGDIDIFDSAGFTPAQIPMDSAEPVFYVSDGILRVSDGELQSGSAPGQWFGYIEDHRFGGLFTKSNDSSGSPTPLWLSADQELVSPTAGICAITTPEVGNSTFGFPGVNSFSREYVGKQVGDVPTVVEQESALNLRVGIQYEGSEFDNLAADWSMTNFGGTGGPNYTIKSDVTDPHPIFGNNNVYFTTRNNATSYHSFYYPDTASNFPINEDHAIAFAIYIPYTDGLDDVLYLQVDASQGIPVALEGYRRWTISAEKIVPDCWNIITLTYEEGSQPLSAYPYDTEEDIDELTFTFKGATHPIGDSPNFYISGPVSIDSNPVDGWQEGVYTFYSTFLYDGDQESLPFLMNGGTTASASGSNLNKISIIGSSILFNFQVYIDPLEDNPLKYYIMNKRITGCRYYWKEESNNNHFLIGEVDFIEKGWKWTPDTDIISYPLTDLTGWAGATPNTIGETNALIKGIKPKGQNAIDTYQSINGYSSRVKSLSAKYKTAVVHGRRTYVGNIRQNGKNYPDRILKSQVNKFDTFPEGIGNVDVVINDGESIVKLESFADRILQFKENSLYIINVSDNIDYLEDEYRNKGCSFPYHVIKTDFGIAWFNIHGVYFYDGQKIINLLEKEGMKLLSETDWETFITDNADPAMEYAHIGYLPKQRQLLIKNKNTDIHIYDYVTGSWMKGDQKIVIGTNMTNFALDKNRELFYVDGANSDFKIWNNDSTDTSSFELITKDIDFIQPAMRKKVYKVYVTYTGGDSGPQPEITEIVCAADVSYSLNGTWFYIYGAGGLTSVWLDVNNNGTPASDPGGGAQNIEVDGISTGDTAEQVATAVAYAVDNHANFSCEVQGQKVIITDSADVNRTDAYDNDTGFDISVKQQGTNTTVAQNIDIEYRTNGTGSWLQFDGNLTDNSGNQVVAELVPLVSVNNIKSIQLRFSGTASNTFEINDISLIFRMKSPK